MSYRAKQFAPFAALKEFEACVCKKEELYVPYLELSDEAKEEIDFKLRMLNYMTGSVWLISRRIQKASCLLKSTKITGTVEYIDPLHRYIRIDDTEIILISITEIEALWWDFL